jgi:hypothetical protein
MKTITKILLIILSSLFTIKGYAEETISWTPKWHIGDWWIIELHYDASRFTPEAKKLKPNPKQVKVKFEIVGKEKFEEEPVYRLKIQALDPAISFADNYFLLISTENLAIRKIQRIWGNIEDNYIIDKENYGPFTGGENFSLYTLPAFPLTSKSNNLFLIKYHSGDPSKMSRSLRTQKTNLISLADIEEKEKITKIQINKPLYKFTLDKTITQVWCEDVSWYIYFEQGSVKGYLKEYRLSAKK